MKQNTKLPRLIAKLQQNTMESLLAMNDLNSLMSRIDEINSKTPRELDDNDIDTLIAYHRRNRQRKAAGEKLVGTKSTAKSSGIDIMALMNLNVAKPKQVITTDKITRRI